MEPTIGAAPRRSSVVSPPGKLSRVAEESALRDLASTLISAPSLLLGVILQSHLEFVPASTSPPQSPPGQRALAAATLKGKAPPPVPPPRGSVSSTSSPLSKVGSARAVPAKPLSDALLTVLGGEAPTSHPLWRLLTAAVHVESMRHRSRPSLVSSSSSSSLLADKSPPKTPAPPSNSNAPGAPSKSHALPTTFLRDNSVGATILSTYVQGLGGEWIGLALAPIIDDIAGMSPSAFEIPSEQDLKSLDPADGPAAPVKALMDTVDSAFKALIKAVPTAPRALRLLCGLLYTHFESIKEPMNPRKAVGALMFLRFIIPSIVAPEAGPLGERVQASSTALRASRRNVIRAGRLMQSIANRTLSSVKDPALVAALPAGWFDSQVEQLDTFITSLVILTPAVPANRRPSSRSLASTSSNSSSNSTSTETTDSSVASAASEPPAHPDALLMLTDNGFEAMRVIHKFLHTVLPWLSQRIQSGPQAMTVLLAAQDFVDLTRRVGAARANPPSASSIGALLATLGAGVAAAGEPTWDPSDRTSKFRVSISSASSRSSMSSTTSSASTSGFKPRRRNSILMLPWQALSSVFPGAGGKGHSRTPSQDADPTTAGSSGDESLGEYNHDVAAAEAAFASGAVEVAVDAREMSMSRPRKNSSSSRRTRGKKPGTVSIGRHGRTMSMIAAQGRPPSPSPPKSGSSPLKGSSLTPPPPPGR